MPVQVVETYPGFGLAYGLKLQELQQKYPINQELGAFVKESIIATTYPELMDKQVVVEYTNGKLFLRVNMPDEAPVQAVGEPAEEVRAIEENVVAALAEASDPNAAQ